MSRILHSPARLTALQPALTGFAPLPLRSTYLVLATAHLDKDPSNNDALNLSALCQRCHLAHVRAAHRRQPWKTLFYPSTLTRT